MVAVGFSEASPAPAPSRALQFTGIQSVSTKATVEYAYIVLLNKCVSGPCSVPGHVRAEWVGVTVGPPGLRLLPWDIWLCCCSGLSVADPPLGFSLDNRLLGPLSPSQSSTAFPGVQRMSRVSHCGGGLVPRWWPHLGEVGALVPILWIVSPSGDSILSFNPTHTFRGE